MRRGSPDKDLRAEAADWFVLLDSGRASDESAISSDPFRLPARGGRWSAR